MTMVGVTTFHHSCRVFAKSLRKNWPISGRSAKTSPLTDLKLIKAYLRQENRGDILIRVKLPPPGTPTHTSKPSCKRCMTRCCKYSLALDRTGRITSKTTGRSYVSLKNVTCKSFNLIYCLSCGTCGQQYVAQTQQTLIKSLHTYTPSKRMQICWNHIDHLTSLNPALNASNNM